VDEEALLRDLPMDIRRDNKPQFCLDHVRRAPLVDDMDIKLFNTHGYLDTHRVQGGWSALAEAPKENMPARSIGGGSRSGG
jgi:hypothetical protein